MKLEQKSRVDLEQISGFCYWRARLTPGRTHHIPQDKKKGRPLTEKKSPNEKNEKKSEIPK